MTGTSTLDYPTIYEMPDGSFRVTAARLKADGKPHTPDGYLVRYTLGTEFMSADTLHPTVPHMALLPEAVDGHTRASHPLADGQEARYNPAAFRTKTGARAYMNAVHASGILPTDRPATGEEIRNLRDWIIAEAEAGA